MLWVQEMHPKRNLCDAVNDNSFSVYTSTTQHQALLCKKHLTCHFLYGVFLWKDLPGARNETLTNRFSDLRYVGQRKRWANWTFIYTKGSPENWTTVAVPGKKCQLNAKCKCKQFMTTEERNTTYIMNVQILYYGLENNMKERKQRERVWKRKANEPRLVASSSLILLFLLHLWCKPSLSLSLGIIQ